MVALPLRYSNGSFGVFLFFWQSENQKIVSYNSTYRGAVNRVRSVYCLLRTVHCFADLLGTFNYIVICV